MAKVFSGLQPTGNLTIGNYLGAIYNWVQMQNQDNCIFCIVDLHAMTLPQDPNALRKACLDNLALYIACGLDPEKAILFIQSSVSFHAELGWILGCVTPVGWLNRMTQFKDKGGKDKEKASLGLYSYPVLMAADILLYDATTVPVGEDQKQHVELARDIVGAFNRQFNVEYFKEPIAVMKEETQRIMSLRDGKKKMSKSDESDYSRINMTDEPDIIMQKIKKAKTDAMPGIYFDEENRPEVSNLLNIYCAFSKITVEEAQKKFSSYQTSQFKEELAQLIIDKLNPIQSKYKELIKDPEKLRHVANLGANKAYMIAEKRIKEIRKIVGLSI